MNKITTTPGHSAGAFTRKINLFFLQALAVAVISTVIFSCKNNTTTTDTAAKKADSLHTSYDSLQSQFNASRAQIDELTSKSAAIDSALRQKDAEIAKLDNKIAKLQRSNRSLTNKVKADKKLIASLRDELSGKESAYAEKLGMLQNDRNDLIRQRDSLLSKYNYIKQLGSVLHASNIRLSALHLKHHGQTEKNTHRARKADVLRVYFDIDENRIAEDGTKKLYLVIKDPSGNLLSNPSVGSGTTTDSKGGQLNYSVVKEIALKQNEPVYNVTSDWKQEDDFKKGEYTITIYNEGYKIGGGKVILN